jgi:hypothetical protein
MAAEKNRTKLVKNNETNILIAIRFYVNLNFRFPTAYTEQFKMVHNTNLPILLAEAKEFCPEESFIYFFSLFSA